MNPGSIAKKYIEIYFEEQIKNGTNNIVIFDQIENDVDKEFINEVIRNLIGDTKGHVQLKKQKRINLNIEILLQNHMKEMN